jgi:hypothetical protein
MFKWFREFETKLKKKKKKGWIKVNLIRILIKKKKKSRNMVLKKQKKKTIVTQTCPKLNYLASGCRQDEEIK